MVRAGHLHHKIPAGHLRHMIPVIPNQIHLIRGQKVTQMEIEFRVARTEHHFLLCVRVSVRDLVCELVCETWCWCFLMFVYKSMHGHI